MKLLLGLFLAAFVAQSADLFALFAPDDCVEWSSTGQQESDQEDSCPDVCPRCVCCARTAPVVSSPVASSPAGGIVVAMALPDDDSPASPDPRGVFHVPKTR